VGMSKGSHDLSRSLWNGDAVDEELDRPGGQAAGVDRVPAREGG
jgi:hypothetical protein